MRIDLPPSPRILVVVLQRLGDVLLSTPLIRSLKRAWPEARIDALVFADTAGILAANPDITNVIAMPARPNLMQSLRVAARIFGRYDLSISTQAGDRPTFFACIGGGVRVAPVERRLSGHLKNFFLRRSVSVGPKIHRVREVLRLAEVLGIEPVGQVVTPDPVVAPIQPTRQYAVLHPAPMFRYKEWTADGWRALAQALVARGLEVVVTGGPAARERAYLDEISAEITADVIRQDGCLDWRQLTALLAGARLYVGPDTSVTHLAAATGCATVALFGPTDPILWGPWPAGGLKSAWSEAAQIQRRENVWLVQEPLPCVPCQQEGCERSLGSYSRCLDQMPLGRVLDTINQVLSEPFEQGGVSARTSL
jgi:heptosyltransferase-3